MRVIYKVPGQDPHQMIIPNDPKVMQSLVGGPIEVVTLKDETVAICNEHGKLLGLDRNIYIEALEDTLVGPVIFAGIDGEELTDINPLVARFIRFSLNEEGRL